MNAGKWTVVYLLAGTVFWVGSRLLALVKKGEVWTWVGFRHDLGYRDILPVALLVALWPLVAALLLVDVLITRWEVFLRGSEPHRHHCQLEHLLTKVSVSEAEAGAAVIDPLGRVPDLPFGHLNAGWKSFLALKKPGWQLWQFEYPGIANVSERRYNIQWGVPRGRKAGYAWTTRWKRVECEFITEWD